MVYPIKFATFQDQSGAQPQQPQNMPQPSRPQALHSHACPIAAAARSTCNHAEGPSDCAICQAFTDIEAAQDGWLQNLCICEQHNPNPRLDTPAGRHKLEEKVKETGDRELITLSWARGTIRSLAQIIDDNFERVLQARVTGRDSITQDDVDVINEAGQLMERIMPHIHDTNGNFWIDDKKLLIPVQDFEAPPPLKRQRHPAADDRHFRESREAWLAFVDFERRVDNDLVFMDREQCYISDLLPGEERERIDRDHGQNQQQYLNQRYAEAQRLTRESMVEDELLEGEVVEQQQHAPPLVVNGSTPNPVATLTTLPRPSTGEQKQETQPQPAVSIPAPQQPPTAQQPNVKQARTGPAPPQQPQQKAQMQASRPLIVNGSAPKPTAAEPTTPGTKTPEQLEYEIHERLSKAGMWWDEVVLTQPRVTQGMIDEYGAALMAVDQLEQQLQQARLPVTVPVAVPAPAPAPAPRPVTGHVPVPPPPPARQPVPVPNPNPAPRPVTLPVRAPAPPPAARPVANGPGLKRKASEPEQTTPGAQTREQQEARLRAARAAVPAYYDPQMVTSRHAMNEPQVAWLSAYELAQQRAEQKQAQQGNHRPCVQGIVSELDLVQALKQQPGPTLQQQVAEQKQDSPLVVNGSAAPKRAVVGTRGGKKKQQQQQSQPRANTSPHHDSPAARMTEQMNLDQQTLQQREAAEEQQFMAQLRLYQVNSPGADAEPNPAAIRAVQNQQLEQQMGAVPLRPQEPQPVPDETIEIPELYWSRYLARAPAPELSSTTTTDTASSTKPTPVKKEDEEEETVAEPKASEATDVKVEQEDDAPKSEDKDKTEKQPEPEQQGQQSTSGSLADSLEDLLQEQYNKQQQQQQQRPSDREFFPGYDLAHAASYCGSLAMPVQSRDGQTRSCPVICQPTATSLDVDTGFVVPDAADLESIRLRPSMSSPENDWMEVVMGWDGTCDGDEFLFTF